MTAIRNLVKMTALDVNIRRSYIFVELPEENKKEKYRKIPIISPGLILFRKPFLGGLFSRGLIFRGAYYRGDICV